MRIACVLKAYYFCGEWPKYTRGYMERGVVFLSVSCWIEFSGYPKDDKRAEMPCGENRMASIFLWGFPYPIFSDLKMDAKKSKGRIPIRHKCRVKSYLKFTFFAVRYNQKLPYDHWYSVKVHRQPSCQQHNSPIRVLCMHPYHLHRLSDQAGNQQRSGRNLPASKTLNRRIHFPCLTFWVSLLRCLENGGYVALLKIVVFPQIANNFKTLLHVVPPFHGCIVLYAT